MDIRQAVSQLMKKELITVGTEDPLLKVEKVFRENKIHHLPVLDEGKLVGMLSKSDFLFFKKGFSESKKDEELETFRLKSHRVREIMTTGLAKLEPDDRVDVALEVFKENMFHALPVVENGRIVGILTTFDIIDALSKSS